MSHDARPPCAPPMTDRRVSYEFWTASGLGASALWRPLCPFHAAQDPDHVARSRMRRDPRARVATHPARRGALDSVRASGSDCRSCTTRSRSGSRESAHGRTSRSPKGGAPTRVPPTRDWRNSHAPRARALLCLPDQRPQRHRLGRRLRACSLQEPQTERREHRQSRRLPPPARRQPTSEEQTSSPTTTATSAARKARRLDW